MCALCWKLVRYVTSHDTRFILVHDNRTPIGSIVPIMREFFEWFVGTIYALGIHNFSHRKNKIQAPDSWRRPPELYWAVLYSVYDWEFDSLNWAIIRQVIRIDILHPIWLKIGTLLNFLRTTFQPKSNGIHGIILIFQAYDLHVTLLFGSTPQNS